MAQIAQNCALSQPVPIALGFLACIPYSAGLEGSFFPLKRWLSFAIPESVSLCISPLEPQVNPCTHLEQLRA